MAVGTAFRAFFAALFDQEIAEQLRVVLDSPQATKALTDSTPVVAESAPAAEPKNLKSAARENRSDAITLLATLQREARLIDLVQEDLERYSDAQIGAAARPCLQQCATTLNRLFSLRAIETAAEGQSITVPGDATPLRFQWIGEGAGATGKLVHHGWEASRTELPQWTGVIADALVIAPVQVQREKTSN